MKRNAFTLIELLIVITILIILAGLTVTAYSSLTGGEKMRAASRQLQSAILGARDRAIQSGRTYGVRLSPDSSQSGAITSLNYVSQPPNWTDGRIELWRDANGDVKIVKELASVPAGHKRTGWYNLKQHGLLAPGLKIRISQQGSWYTIADVSQLTATTETLILREKFRSAPVESNPAKSAFPPLDYEMQLYPHIAPGTDPITLPAGCGIDIAKSLNLPVAKPYDLLFSGRGVPTGWAASRHKIFFLLSELGDIEAGLDPSKREGDMKVVSLRGSSGAVTSHEPDVTDANNDGKADNLFRFAETGASAGK